MSMGEYFKSTDAAITTVAKRCEVTSEECRQRTSKAASAEESPHVSRSRHSRLSTAYCAASEPLWPSKTAMRCAGGHEASMGQASRCLSSILSAPLDPGVVKKPTDICNTVIFRASKEPFRATQVRRATQVSSDQTKSHMKEDY